ncbi:hypothetical protein [Plasticicumulans acidivorans]|uniref:Transmembrane protein n=1 Tax=Plasticicumulans acidivorans TaxID=886464 RepID=A0A317MZB0_9GAMM|nr:hypothetical protein [Plasticicumulans acidivorans]PWV64698.1 hypothetical protein C7443_102350 [Plasticicumulans acidivorans]
MISKVQHVASVLWPSFVLAGIGTVVLSTIFDPLAVSHCLGVEGISRTGSYSLGFFSLWSMNIASSVLTLYFRQPVHTPAECPVRDFDPDRG